MSPQNHQPPHSLCHLRLTPEHRHRGAQRLCRLVRRMIRRNGRRHLVGKPFDASLTQRARANACTHDALRELISEMVSEQNPNACQMNKADVVFDLILIAHCNPAIAQQPAVQAFNLPSPLVSPQRPTILRFRSGAIATMWSDHLDATLSQCSIQRVRVIRLVANQTFGFIRHKISVGSTSWDSCGEALDA
jgi:hypothetical protein